LHNNIYWNKDYRNLVNKEKKPPRKNKISYTKEILLLQYQSRT